MATSRPLDSTSMNDLTTCVICLSTMVEPKSLHCLHTFCRLCLEDYVQKNADSNNLTCPTCREVFTLPTNGVKGLRNNFFIKTLLASSSGENKGIKYCVTHSDELMRFYCTTCKVPFCAKCMLNKHNGHRSEEITSTYTQYKERFCNGITVLDRTHNNINLLVSKWKDAEKQVSREYAVDETKIKEKCKEMRNLVEKYEKELLREAAVSRDRRMKQVRVPIDALTEQEKLLGEYKQQLINYRDSRSHYDVVSDGETLLQEVDELKTYINTVHASSKLDIPVWREFIPTTGAVLQKELVGEFKTRERILLTLGLNDGALLQQKICEISLEKRYTIKVINSTPAQIWRESAACVVSNVLYAVGIGGGAYNQLWAWSASRDEWTRCADMTSGRCRHCVTSVGDKIYLLGGWVEADERTHDSILCYDINSNKWSEAGKLCHAVWGAACENYKHYVYLFGGADKDNKAVNHVQVYDTTTRNVSLASNPMPAAYSHMRAGLWRSKALLIGWVTCYIYDFESSTWQERKRFKTDVYYFGLTLDDNALYISGGGTYSDGVWTCRADVKSLLVDDFISDNNEAEWKHHATLPTRALMQAYSPVPLLM